MNTQLTTALNGVVTNDAVELAKSLGIDDPEVPIKRFSTPQNGALRINGKEVNYVSVIDFLSITPSFHLTWLADGVNCVQGPLPVNATSRVNTRDERTNPTGSCWSRPFKIMKGQKYPLHQIWILGAINSPRMYPQIQPDKVCLRLVESNTPVWGVGAPPYSGVLFVG